LKGNINKLDQEQEYLTCIAAYINSLWVTSLKLTQYKWSICRFLQ